MRHAAAPGAGGRTPSDLPLVALTQGEIEQLESEYPQIEDILPLSPLQEGLLFHALYDAQAPDVYTVQLDLGLEGPLDSEALEAAAQALVQRHASLRASFRHENLSRPVQIILPLVKVPWHRIDLSLLDDAGRAERLAGILAQDRAERFDLATAPLLRFTLIRLAPDRHRLVLTNHHILMDGWSMPVLVQELLTLYAQPRAMPRAAAGDALSRLSGLDRGAGSRRGDRGLAGGSGGTGRGHPCWRRTIPGGRRSRPSRSRWHSSETLTAALTLAGARGRA